MSTLNLRPPTLDVYLIRGDTRPFEFSIADANGDAVNIAGWAFLLTVDPSKRPADNTANVLQLSGTIVSAAEGVVRFALSEPQAATTPGNYFYDLQAVDTEGKTVTVLRGQWVVEQDITK